MPPFYEFAGQVLDVAENPLPMVGLRAWKLYTRITRLSGTDGMPFEILLHVTERSLAARQPPLPDTQISGTLWLHGYLCWAH